MDAKRKKMFDQGCSGSSNSASNGGDGAYNVPVRTLYVAAIKADVSKLCGNNYLKHIEQFTELFQSLMLSDFVGVGFFSS